ncbi:hypothetical protein [Vibrio cholerae]|uniref:hypothetical protein n=1 Tax=Vibrio cholerae TaxID=666 RepID=UPI0011156559|nr:hypothetical protein [Vibrio cholerae]WOQ88825.1 hypothetical protein R4535_06900 [Vibrio cholerae]
MSPLHIYIIFLLPTFTVMADPVIVQRVVATADIIINPNHTVSVYMSTTRKKFIEQKDISSIVTLSVNSLNGIQQSYLVFPIKHEKHPHNCTYSMGKLHSSNKIYHCLNGHTNSDVVYIDERIYHSVPTKTDIYIRTLYSKNPIANDTYVLPIEIISYTH